MNEPILPKEFWKELSRLSYEATKKWLEEWSKVQEWLNKQDGKEPQ